VHGLAPESYVKLVALMSKHGTRERLSVVLRTSVPTLEKAVDGVASAGVVERLEAAITKEYERC
jgi:hypothetical protein